jgi:hypothetical protein
MSETLNRVILNGATVQIVPLSEEEIALIEESKQITAAESATIAAAEAAKATAQAKLTALGLTVDDLKALGL